MSLYAVISPFRSHKPAVFGHFKNVLVFVCVPDGLFTRSFSKVQECILKCVLGV